MPKTLKIKSEVSEAAKNSVRGTIRAEMVREDVGYRDLAARLNMIGYDENEGNLRNKITRGEMQASLFLMILRVLRSNNRLVTDLPFLDHQKWDYGSETGVEYDPKADRNPDIRHDPNFKEKK